MLVPPFHLAQWVGKGGDLTKQVIKYPNIWTGQVIKCILALVPDMTADYVGICKAFNYHAFQQNLTLSLIAPLMYT